MAVVFLATDAEATVTKIAPSIHDSKWIIRSRILSITIACRIGAEHVRERIRIRGSVFTWMTSIIHLPLIFVRHLHGLGTRLVRALRRDQSDHFLHRAFVGHLEKSLRHRTETVLPPAIPVCGGPEACVCL